MGPLLEWARAWEAFISVIGTAILLWFVRETYLMRLATITSAAPSVTLIVADAKNQPRLQVFNIEGRVARNVLLDGFTGAIGEAPVRCTFKPIPHLRLGEPADLKAEVEALVESPEGSVFYEGDAWLEVLHSATGKVTGLPLRMRYEDGTGMTYVVKVTMPNRIDLGFMGVLDRQPSCSPPKPMVTFAKIEDRIIWPVARAMKHRKIRREVSVRRRREKDASNAFTRAALEAVGFRGFVTIDDLRKGRIDDVPREPGVYVVMRDKDDPPTFLQESPAGWFKRKNPTADIPTLKAAWVPRAHTLYIGMTSQRDGLRARLKDLIDFGAGQAVGHWGGRYLWQVAGSSDFVVAWRESSPGVNPLDEEKELLRRFRETYGRLPFANLQD